MSLTAIGYCRGQNEEGVQKVIILKTEARALGADRASSPVNPSAWLWVAELEAAPWGGTPGCFVPPALLAGGRALG